jgi:Tol biopolymer transport system component
MSVMDERLLPAGVDVERYRVDSLLAVGGMSEVYAAHDTVLGRPVALKVLRDGERAGRFIREAEAASSLNHPAIVSVYDSGTAVIAGETVRFLAMELVEGETLAVWARNTRDPRRRIEAMAGVADGLARAHAHGIIHRDLKPDNIMIARGGYPKILDFGIAKLTDPLPCRQGDTAPDALLGTAAYMSPEQAERRPLDHRSDIFAFGSVLYEVVTGKAAFRRDGTVDTLHAIAHETPSLHELDPALARIIRRCLAKSPDDRYHSLRDVALDLRELPGLAPRPAVRRPARVVFLALLAAVVLLATAAVFVRRWEEREAGVPEVTASLPQSRTNMHRVTNDGKTFCGAVSPDGRFVAYTALTGIEQSLWIKQIATGSSVRLLPPAAGYYSAVAFSPDGEYIYYGWATRDEPNVVDLLRVSAIGGEPQRIAADVEADFAVSPDGKSVAFRRFNALQRDYVLLLVTEGSRVERELLRKRHPERIAFEAWLPGGKELGFSYLNTTPHAEPQFIALNIATGAQRHLPMTQWRRITEWRGIGSYLWLPDGSGVVATIAAQRQPPQVWWAPNDGAPRKITSDISIYSNLSVTADGSTILAARQEESTNIWLATVGERNPRPLTTGTGNRHGIGGLTWSKGEILFTSAGRDAPVINAVDPSGVMREVAPRVQWLPNASRDGSRVAFISDSSGNVEVWVADRDGEHARQLTHGGRAGSPRFFPDGSLAYLLSSRDQTLWRISPDGLRQTQLTHTPTFAPAISFDGKWIVCRLRATGGPGPLWRTVLLSGDGQFIRELALPRFGGGPLLGWTPEGRIAFVDQKDGVSNVWSVDRDGSDVRQLTFFDSGQIYAFEFSPDGHSIAISRGDPVSDLVLIRDFR